MQMTTEARAWLDETVKRILARHPLGDAERAGVTYELMSHLHAAGEANATAAGRTEVTPADLQLALLNAGGEEAMAAAFVQPLARPVQRVLFWRRLGALAIDAVLLGIALTFVHSVLASLLMRMGSSGSDTMVKDLDWFAPWGYHPGLGPLGETVIILASAALVLGYFTWFESHEGRSLGKRALGLRVMRADGEPITEREAFLRNVVKIAPPFLVLDTLVMLIAFQKEAQRVSDRIAGTIVVRA